MKSLWKKTILPYSPDAWINEKKTKVGYEISMTKYFFNFSDIESVEEIVGRIKKIETSVSAHLDALFSEVDE